MTDLSALDFRKSTRSNPNNACVEVAKLPAGAVAVRDSKHGGTGPVFRFDKDEWEAFIEGVRLGEFDNPAPKDPAPPAQQDPPCLVSSGMDAVTVRDVP